MPIIIKGAADRYIIGEIHGKQSVNSSTYAVPFYQSLGFKVVGDKECNKGIVSVPMVKD